jgi:hypothetical protein
MAQPAGVVGVPAHAHAGGAADEGEEEVPKAVRDRAEQTKDYLAAQMARRRQEMAERQARRQGLNRALADPSLSDVDKARLKAEYEARERDASRAARKRFAPSDFESLVVIGRGAFGEVSGRESGAAAARAALSGLVPSPGVTPAQCHP